MRKNKEVLLIRRKVILLQHIKPKNQNSVQMKKVIVATLLVVFVAAGLTSCKSHERCAAYGKINKIETEKPLVDKTQSEI
jgi:hypothetical protein